jgi:hypothetical protein
MFDETLAGRVMQFLSQNRPIGSHTPTYDFAFLRHTHLRLGSHEYQRKLTLLADASNNAGSNTVIHSRLPAHSNRWPVKYTSTNAVPHVRLSKNVLR